MRKTALALNTIVVVFFICFLAYTFVARQHVDSLARDFVIEKTLGYSKPVVELADEALGSPLVMKFLSDDQEFAVRHSLHSVESFPGRFILFDPR